MVTLFWIESASKLCHFQLKVCSSKIERKLMPTEKKYKHFSTHMSPGLTVQSEQSAKATDTPKKINIFEL